MPRKPHAASTPEPVHLPQLLVAPSPTFATPTLSEWGVWQFCSCPWPRFPFNCCCSCVLQWTTNPIELKWFFVSECGTKWLLQREGGRWGGGRWHVAGVVVHNSTFKFRIPLVFYTAFAFAFVFALARFNLIWFDSIYCLISYFFFFCFFLCFVFTFCCFLDCRNIRIKKFRLFERKSKSFIE